MRLIIFSALLLVGLQGVAQSPRVPSKMEFAGIQLKITESARKELQDKVDKLTASPRHFNIKAERAASYFPIVEQIFEEEGLPDDFKYLAIHESGFVSDAVSSSNAVGYWQFKKETAEEMGLRIDSRVDERMNIVSSTRAAANYLQQNNLFFNNWVHALQAYQMGAGGTQRSLDRIESGATHMTITKDTYWYVLTFLAHKIAYEEAVELARNSAPRLYIYSDGAGKSLKEISQEISVPADTLEVYNKWLKTRTIPDDKQYAVVVPYFNPRPLTPFKGKKDSLALAISKNVENIEIPHTMPAIKQLTINGLPAIMSNTELTIDDLAAKLKISPTDFSSYNDILPHYSVLPNQVYYLKRKLNKAKVYYHTVKENETLWSISQEYGVKVARIKKMNRMGKNEDELEAGRVLWLRKVRPKNKPIEYK
ncbi:MAG: transglycosylase SLT domain-containing protein [Cyclobacteriaceae bacterium]|nr:transglycosylase SLT domain-containing protein [Cyclobacteriaceae bacterium]